MFQIATLLINNLGKLKLLFGNKYKKVTLANLVVFIVSLCLGKFLKLEDNKALELAYMVLGINIEEKYVYIFFGIFLIISIISGLFFIYYLFKKEQSEQETKRLEISLKKAINKTKLLEEELTQIKILKEIKELSLEKNKG